MVLSTTIQIVSIHICGDLNRQFQPVDILTIETVFLSLAFDLLVRQTCLFINIEKGKNVFKFAAVGVLHCLAPIVGF